MTTPTKLSQVFLEQGLITKAQLAEALELQNRENRFFGSVLVERGWVAPDALLAVLSEHYGMPTARLAARPIDKAAVDAVPLKVVLHYQIMPLQVANGTLTVAIANPQDIRVLDELRLALHQRYAIESVLTMPEDIAQAIKQHYGVGAETVDKLLSERGAAPSGVPDDALDDVERVAADASVMNLVNQLIVEAHQRRATDIHLEPFRGKVRLRYRIDGMLHDVDVPPQLRQLFPAIVSRIKVLSNLNIVERRLPQDGRASVKAGEQKLDLRISVVPSSAGESVVIRILPGQMLMSLTELGFREDDRKVLEAILRKPNGLMFLTGPTGSGKTTTLYACLKAINTEEHKIITLEDPIEYELDGVIQVQINPAIGFTFAKGLRSLLRHDPNVMMVGEVRDVETAELAIRISLTGHLVLSTLHTNDAIGGIIRLMDMGIDPYLIASSVECVIAQRLVRLLCPACKEKASTKGTDLQQMFKAKGCDACHRTGFKGRLAIYEFFLMSQELKDLVLRKAPGEQIQRAAVEQGMRTMRDDGWDKINHGLTTVDEVLRVTQDDA